MKGTMTSATLAMRSPPMTTKGRAGGYHHGGDDHRPGIFGAEQGDAPAVVWVEYAVYRGGDAVDLGHGADAQKPHAHAEEGEELTEPFPAPAHAVLNVVEGAASTWPSLSISR